MKVLIAVLSYPVSPWAELKAAQIETWDAFFYPQVDTVFFEEGDQFDFRCKTLRLPGCTGFNRIYWKIKLALSAILVWDFQFVFLTNSSSYVCKRRLWEFAQTMPTERCYCGVLHNDTPGFPFASGSGMLLSRDVVELLAIGLPEVYPVFHFEDRIYSDVAIAMELAKHGVTVTPGARRFDYYPESGPVVPDSIPDEYHYRCKTFNGPRSMDIEAFKRIMETKRWLYG